MQNAAIFRLCLMEIHQIAALSTYIPTQLEEKAICVKKYRRFFTLVQNKSSKNNFLTSHTGQLM